MNPNYHWSLENLRHGGSVHLKHNLSTKHEAMMMKSLDTFKIVMMDCHKLKYCASCKKIVKEITLISQTSQ